MNAFKRSTAVAALLLATGCGYNTIQTYDEQVNAAASQIKVQLQRRADLIPNLVETVKGFAKQEQTVFGDIANARSASSGLLESAILSDNSLTIVRLDPPPADPGGRHYGPPDPPLSSPATRPTGFRAGR